MEAKNFNNERPDYGIEVILILKNGNVLKGSLRRTDAKGHIYVCNEGYEYNEKDILGWLPIPKKVEDLHPTCE